MQIATTELDTLARNAAEAARLLRAIANDRRLMVLCTLASAGEISVNPLAAQVGLSQSALSQHLALLRDEGLVATRRAGTTIHYRIADSRVMALLLLMHALFCPEGGGSPGRPAVTGLQAA